MRVGKDEAVHLTYCTNIHPGEGWDEVFGNLEAYLPGLKQALAPERPFGVGLRLSDRAARELGAGDRLARFKAWLDDQGCYVFTMNGFPYGGFHRQVVKDRVYAPDWRTQERVDYTVRLAHLLAELLPDTVEDGGISTVPVSYKPWFAPTELDAVCREAARRLAEVTAELVRLRSRTGRYLHVDLEPEPDCLLETTGETLGFFERWLLPAGGDHLADLLGCSMQEAWAHLLAHVNICYDTCHFAVEYESPAEVVGRLREAGIRIGKVQLSTALKAFVPEEAAERTLMATRLRGFAESTYLHQVVERRADGTLHHYPDLPQALDHYGRAMEEWRIHFHVPLFVNDYAGLASTRDDLVAALADLRDDPYCRHLEIETYTWEVLPPGLKEDLATSIEREYRWVLGQLAQETPGAA